MSWKELKQVADIQRNALTVYIPSPPCCVTAQSELKMHMHYVGCQQLVDPNHTFLLNNLFITC